VSAYRIDQEEDEEEDEQEGSVRVYRTNETKTSRRRRIREGVPDQYEDKRRVNEEDRESAPVLEEDEGPWSEYRAV